MPDPTPDDDRSRRPDPNEPGDPARADDDAVGGATPDDDDRDPEARLKDELDRIFLANMQANEAPWKTWKRPASREEAGPWWRPFAYLAAALAVAALFVVLATR